MERGDKAAPPDFSKLFRNPALLDLGRLTPHLHVLLILQTVMCETLGNTETGNIPSQQITSYSFLPRCAKTRCV